MVYATLRIIVLLVQVGVKIFLIEEPTIFLVLLRGVQFTFIQLIPDPHSCIIIIGKGANRTKAGNRERHMCIGLVLILLNFGQNAI
jgi:hypothetical protein